MTDATAPPDEPIEAQAFEQLSPDDAHVEQAPTPEPAHAGELVPHMPAAVERHVGPRLIDGKDLTVIPQMNELDLLAQMAVTIAAATTAPKALQGRPNDVFMVLLTARDLGVALTTAIREFHVIDGKVTLSPKVRLAMVRAKGIGKVWADPENDATKATWYAVRNDLPGITSSSTYTIEMAGRVKAKEGGQTITLAQKSTWKQYPERMLSWRALGYLMDDVFGEIGTGLYSPDELGAVTDEDGVPVIDVVGHAEPIRGTSAPAGHNAPPPPPASDEDREALQASIERLRLHSPEARAALIGLWTAPDEGGTPKLPPMRSLLARQVNIARALVKSVEDRAKKGEWGDWHEDPAPEPAETGADAPEATTPDSPAPATTAPDPEPKADSEAPAEDDRPAMIMDFVNGMDSGAVNTGLEARDQPTTGTIRVRRLRLAQILLTEAHEADTGDGTAVEIGSKR